MGETACLVLGSGEPCSGPANMQLLLTRVAERVSRVALVSCHEVGRAAELRDVRRLQEVLIPDMSNARARVIEVCVIVGSILLAFAIEAGWDARGEARDEALVLGALRSEMESTVERIDAHLERRSGFSDALSTFLETPPETLAALDPDSAASLLRSLTLFAAFTASAGSVRSLDVTALDDVELRTLLGAWQGGRIKGCVKREATYLPVGS